MTRARRPDACRKAICRAAGAFLVLLIAVGLPAESVAQEWFDDYERAVSMLDRGDAEPAIPLLERAIRRRPEPGTNLLTYGTNRLAEYFPYLKLAEAQLAVGDLDAASETLERSAASGIEPEDAREALSRRVASATRAAAVASRAGPTPAPPSASSPPSTSPPPEAATAPALPAPSPEPEPRTGTLEIRTVPTGASVVANGRLLGDTPLSIELDPGAYAVTLRREGWLDATVDVAVEAGSRVTVDRSLEPVPSAPAPAGDGAAPPRPVAPPDAPAPAPLASLVVISNPPGAEVYLDDEPLGSTDPETGRLVKSDVAVGTHRLRLARPGYLDGVAELDFEAGRETRFESALDLVSAPVAAPAPAPAAAPARPPLAESETAIGTLIVLAVGIVAAGAFLWYRESRRHRGTGGGWLSRTFGLSAPFARLRRRGAARRADPDHMFGEYELLELIGRGGMAEVYRARRGSDVCALKRPLDRFLDDSEFRERFLREAEIGRTLHHPNIIRILDRGEVDGVPYFTMELLSGSTLRERLKQGVPFGAGVATSIVLQVAEALDYAHHKGIVHRDVTTANIMVQRDGLVKVMDYGIASARRFAGLTMTGAFMGTPDYVAPEVASGKPADGRSDLYSLGVVFYELLTGRRPFVGATPLAILNMHREQPPPPPTTFTPSCPHELETIVLRLLEKSPAHRYPDAESLLIDLRAYHNRVGE